MKLPAEEIERIKNHPDEAGLYALDLKDPQRECDLSFRGSEFFRIETEFEFTAGAVLASLCTFIIFD